MVSSILSIVAWVLSLFKKDPSEAARAAGVELGRTQVNAEVGKNELEKAQRAAAAGNDAVAADASGVRDPHPGDAKWDPDRLS